MYEERFYRHLKGAFAQEVAYYESDLYIISDNSIDNGHVRRILMKYYNQIREYIRVNPEFLNSLSPLALDDTAPPIIKDMLRVSLLSGIGPFSSVAGAIAYYVGREILETSKEVIVENGGDIFLKIEEDKSIGIYLGKSFRPDFLAIKVRKRNYPFGICSSSSKIGHSLNFGKADLLTVLAKDTILADSLATAYSNRIQRRKDIGKVLKDARDNRLVEAVIVAFSGELFFWGDIKLA